MSKRVAIRYRKKKSIYSTAEELASAWIAGKYSYGTVKDRTHTREMTFLHDFFFVGNMCVGFKNKESKIITFFAPDGWRIHGTQFELPRSRRNFRKTFRGILGRIRREGEYRVIRATHGVKILSANKNAYQDALRDRYQERIKKLWNELYAQDHKYSEYWYDDQFDELKNTMIQIEEINQASGFHLVSGLSPDELEKFNLDKMMRILGGGKE